MAKNFYKKEEKILKFWKQNKIFEKSIKQRKKARDFVFYEGPPTANGKPGIHHIETRAFKDIICRYKTMRGFRVLRKAGWDTHGLPVELEIEKKLGIKTKKEIEKHGIENFNKKCKNSVWKYKTEWEKLTERIGFWLDFKHPYITYETNYIETIWWIIKQIQKKNLLYQDYKVVPYCPRCGTSLSIHEVAQGYKKVKENSIYVKFPVKNQKNTYFLVWTTTPWTLPGNVAIAINQNFTYCKLKVEKEYFILAKQKIKDCNLQGKIIDEYKGKDIIGTEYYPLYEYKKQNKEKYISCYKIIPADFVSLDQGTGLVHIAPAFGEEDMEAIKTENAKIKTKFKDNELKNNNFPVLVTVNENGNMKTPEYNWNNMFVKKADPLIIVDLDSKGLLLKKELYEHDYPFCWRCKTPLIYYAKKSWFIRMSKIKNRVIKNNEKINWTPSYLKQGRFGEWLKDLKDWTISRERYWGTPLPIWKCEKCGNLEIIGSKNDLLKQKFTTNKYFILRHGESECYKKNILSCSNKDGVCPLTKTGERQIKIAAKELKKEKIDIIFSSDILRTRQTANIVGKETGTEIKYDKRLREINFGIYDNKNFEEWKNFWKTETERFTKKPLQGENYTDAKKRMYKFLKNIDKKYKNKNILIVSHSGPLLMLSAAVKGLSNEEILKLLKKEFELFPVGKWHKLDFKIFPYNNNAELDFHKPYIDESEFFCSKCSGKMKRVPEILDVWFDSGAMPFAQVHFPFACPKTNKTKENYKTSIKKILFPADFICEAIDQTRGWFYTLLAISCLLDLGPSYKNVISLGHVLDKKGEKMSKSKGNVVDPWYIIEKYSSDAVRWYFYTINQPGDSKLFTEKDVDIALKKFILTLWNSYFFLETYSKNTKYKIQNTNITSKNLLDKWIISKLNKLIQETAKTLDKYDITSAARNIENFVINDLSLWYIRRSRKRFQKPETIQELKEASQTLGFVLSSLTKLTAPFIPFLSDIIYQKLQCSKPKTVHLCDFPKCDKKKIDESLEEKMKTIREITSLALNKRSIAGIKVRQPLQKLEIKNTNLKAKEKELLDLIKDEVNIKEIVIIQNKKSENINKQISIKLDTKITPELKEQGIIREIIREIQNMRKRAGYKPEHKILIRYSGTENLNTILFNNKKLILKETGAKDFVLGQRQKQVFDVEREFVIDQQKLWLGMKK